MAATLMCKYCGHAKIPSNNIAPMFKSTYLQRNCAQYASSKAPENVVRVGTSVKTQQGIRLKTFLKFKTKMKRQMEEAQKSMLVNIPDRPNQKPENLTAVKKLTAYHGQIVSVVPVSHCSYLVQFEKGEIPHKHKIHGTKVVRHTQNVSKPICSLVSESGNLKDCIHNIYKTQNLSQTEVQVNFFIASYLSALFKLKAKSQIVPFGSTASGLGLTGYSDLDIVWTKDWQHAGDSYQHRTDLSRVSFLLNSQKPVITKLVRILHASTPILQFQFKPLGVSCDLSRGLFTGVLMAEILCWLNDYDGRFYELLLALKLLFKVHGVVGGGGRLVSSNTLAMLVIAFLQQRSILPPLKNVFHFQFQKGSTWSSTTLNACKPKPLSERDNTDIGALFQECLVFYGTKNFQGDHIDVYHGTIDRSGRTYKPLTLPNPFDFNHNMASSVNQDALASFKIQCCDTLVRINKTRGDNFQTLWNPDAKK